MKYGVHASESVAAIVSRKRRESAIAGVTFWGYGGTLCHPVNQVQPFAKAVVATNGAVYLVMSSTQSELHSDPWQGTIYSASKYEWQSLPTSVEVYGSKYAIVCSDFSECKFDINLADYEVAVGASRGRNLSDYINGRVDKACASLIGENKARSTRIEAKDKRVTITLIARVIEPYSVFIK